LSPQATHHSVRSSAAARKGKKVAARWGDERIFAGNTSAPGW
jgi:hypothetical protein